VILRYPCPGADQPGGAPPVAPVEVAVHTAVDRELKTHLWLQADFKFIATSALISDPEHAGQSGEHEKHQDQVNPGPDVSRDGNGSGGGLFGGGTCAVELTPRFRWDRGRGMAWALGSLGLDFDPNAFTLFVGDGAEDEAVFRAFKPSDAKTQQAEGRVGCGAAGCGGHALVRGLGVVVTADGDRSTEAAFALRDPAEVITFLSALLEHGEGDVEDGRRDNANPLYQGKRLPRSAKDAFQPFDGDAEDSWQILEAYVQKQQKEPEYRERAHGRGFNGSGVGGFAFKVGALMGVVSARVTAHAHAAARFLSSLSPGLLGLQGNRFEALLGWLPGGKHDLHAEVGQGSRIDAHGREAAVATEQTAGRDPRVALGLEVAAWYASLAVAFVVAGALLSRVLLPWVAACDADRLSRGLYSTGGPTFSARARGYDAAGGISGEGAFLHRARSQHSRQIKSGESRGGGGHVLRVEESRSADVDAAGSADVDDPVGRASGIFGKGAGGDVGAELRARKVAVAAHPGAWGKAGAALGPATAQPDQGGTGGASSPHRGKRRLHDD